MLTNLIAGIVCTIVTNTTETVTAWEKSVWVSEPCPNSSEFLFMCAVNHGKMVNSGPLEKTTTVQAVKRANLTVEWMGKSQVMVHDEVLWSSNSVIKLEWVKKP
jgi:hypothetical protein